MLNDSADEPMSRRDALKSGTVLSVALAGGFDCPPNVALAAIPSQTTITERKAGVKIMCTIRYQIDPFQRDAFQAYAEVWGKVIPRCGGHLVGYFLPYEGTNDIAWGLIAFDSLAGYERYRTRIKSDPESRDNLAMAQSKKFILREERNFVEIVDGTFEMPSTLME